MVNTCVPSVVALKVSAHLKANIDTLLRERGLTRKDLAQYCRRSESWISKIFRNPRRELPMRYLDRIADFFGLMPYQLLQPNISPLAERRRATRRRFLDRRAEIAARQTNTDLQHKEKPYKVAPPQTLAEPAPLPSPIHGPDAVAVLTRISHELTDLVQSAIAGDTVDPPVRKTAKSRAVATRVGRGVPKP